MTLGVAAAVLPAGRMSSLTDAGPTVDQLQNRTLDVTPGRMDSCRPSSSASPPERYDMTRLRLLIVGLIFAAIPASAAVLEVPQSGGDASGIGYISGWKCPPNDKITISIDGGDPIPVPSGVRRGDTAGACGNDGRNGFITQMNFGLLGSGFHTVAVRQNGQTFTTSTFNVTTFGTPFLTGASGAYTLLDFPTKGKRVDVDWDQGTQNFVITGTSSGPIPSPTPQPTPKPTAGGGCNSFGAITNLQRDCSNARLSGPQRPAQEVEDGTK